MTNPLHPYSVFISSGRDPRLRGLVDACMQSTWDCNHSARTQLTDTARLPVRNEIENCDIFVRLCWNFDESVRSECFEALDHAKPIILLVLAEGADLAQPQAFVRDAAFGSVVRTTGNDPVVFAREYVLALAHTVRCLDASTHAKLWKRDPLDYAAGNPFWRRFAARIGQWTTLEARFNVNAALKQAAAEFFLDLYFDTLSKAQLSRFFFESGSSIAFLSEGFASHLNRTPRATGITIETNNIMSYMEFVLSQSSPVQLYPAGLPERKYGAVFGGDLARLTVPARGAHPITGRARELVDEFRLHFTEQYSQLGVIFGATSGISADPPETPSGPHVGSYHNMLFKRALLESGAPIIIFADADKLPRPFRPSRCFHVCDDDFSWQYACHTVPLAIVAAFRSEGEASQTIPHLEQLGLDQLECSREKEVPWSMMASNRLFQDRKRDWHEDAKLEDLRATIKNAGGESI